MLEGARETVYNRVSYSFYNDLVSSMRSITLPLRHAWMWFLLVAAIGAFTTPPIALAVGIAIGLFSTQPFPEQTKKFSKLVLQISVVLLGFGMTFREVVHAGADGFLFAAATIGLTLLAGVLLGNLLGVDRFIGWLIAIGTAICGGSAIAAVSVAIDAEQSDTTVAIGTVFLLNAIALYLFPLLGHALHLDQELFGTWVGVAIHDVSSVVGAATVYGDQALLVATAVKLSRILWLLPLVLLSQRMFRGGGDPAARRKRSPFPWFIAWFLLAALAREELPQIAPVLPAIKWIALMGMSASLCMIGSGISPTALRQVGVRPLLLGVLLWLLIGSVSLGVILMRASPT